MNNKNLENNFDSSYIEEPMIDLNEPIPESIFKEIKKTKRKNKKLIKINYGSLYQIVKGDFILTFD